MTKHLRAYPSKVIPPTTREGRRRRAKAERGGIKALALAVIVEAMYNAKGIGALLNQQEQEDARLFLTRDVDPWRELWCDVLGVSEESINKGCIRKLQEVT